MDVDIRSAKVGREGQDGSLITQGGSLRVNGTLPAPGSYTVQVYCRTFLQNRITDAAVEHRSATVAVTVNVV